MTAQNNIAGCSGSVEAAQALSASKLYCVGRCLWNDMMAGMS